MSPCINESRTSRRPSVPSVREEEDEYGSPTSPTTPNIIVVTPPAAPPTTPAILIEVPTIVIEPNEPSCVEGTCSSSPRPGSNSPEASVLEQELESRLCEINNVTGEEPSSISVSVPCSSKLPDIPRASTSARRLSTQSENEDHDHDSGILC